MSVERSEASCACFAVPSRAVIVWSMLKCPVVHIHPAVRARLLALSLSPTARAPGRCHQVTSERDTKAAGSRAFQRTAGGRGDALVHVTSLGGVEACQLQVGGVEGAAGQVRARICSLCWHPGGGAQICVSTPQGVGIWQAPGALSGEGAGAGDDWVLVCKQCAALGSSKLAGACLRHPLPYTAAPCPAACAPGSSVFAGCASAFPRVVHVRERARAIARECGAGSATEAGKHGRLAG